MWKRRRIMKERAEGQVQEPDRRTRLKLIEKIYRAENGAVRVPARAMKNNPRLQMADLRNIGEIKKEAFMNCTALCNARMDRVRVIERRAFSGCVRLKTVDFPRTLNRLELQAFMNDKRLKKACFRKECGLEELGNEVFSGCTGLERVTLPGKLRTIGRRAFYKCTGLLEIEFPLTLQVVGEESFYQCGLSELELPEGLIEIGESAFLKCRDLEYVYVPDTVRKLGRWAFHGCTNLKILEINHDPAEIGEGITNKQCTIRCPAGSKMEEYARSYGINVNSQ